MADTPPPITNNSPVFRVEKLYLKDLSFESPVAPDVFLERREPEVNVQLDTKFGKKMEHHYEVMLEVTIRVTLDEKVLFLVELSYGGLFRMQNIPQEHIAPMLGIECPNILFPYVRQLISQVVGDGGFKPLFLDPINFAALYQQRLQQQRPGGPASQN